MLINNYKEIGPIGFVFSYNLWFVKTVKWYSWSYVDLQVKKTAVLCLRLCDGQPRKSCTVQKQPRVDIQQWLQPVMCFPSRWCYGKSPALKIPSLILNRRKRYSVRPAHVHPQNCTDVSVHYLINIFRNNKSKSLYVTQLFHEWFLQIQEIILNGGRPEVDDLFIVPHYRELMIICWEQEPENRPSFKQVEERLAKLWFQKRWKTLDRIYWSRFKLFQTIIPRSWPLDIDFRNLKSFSNVFFQISNHLKNVLSNTVKMTVKMDRTARSADSATTSYLRSALNLA